MTTAIGIDLGTKYLCARVLIDGRVIKIKNHRDESKIPSCVVLMESGLRVFTTPIDRVSNIRNAKRLIGRRFDDPKIQADMNLWPCRLVNEDGKLKIVAQSSGRDVTVDPEEIIFRLLVEMREIAERFLGHEVDKAVITAPTYFNEFQRRALIAAGARAGLHVLRIVNNPSVAALAYGLTHPGQAGGKILIYHLGAGSVDVSIVTIFYGSIVEVTSTAGDPYLGGADFDSRLVQYLGNEFNHQFRKNVFSNPFAVSRLRAEAERAKCALSWAHGTTVNIEVLYAGHNLVRNISRAHFEELCGDLFQSAMVPVQRALMDANMDKAMINQIILVGGSTRMPKIQKLLQDFFNGKMLNISMDPEEAVAYGAAVQAAILSGKCDGDPVYGRALLIEVAPQSFGIKTPEGYMIDIIERNSPIPLIHYRTFTTNYYPQRELAIQVYEGNHYLANNNNFLGTFQVTGIPLAPKGVPRIVFHFELDRNGFLHVTAYDAGQALEVTRSDFEGFLEPAQTALMVPLGFY